MIDVYSSAYCITAQKTCEHTWPSTLLINYMDMKNRPSYVSVSQKNSFLAAIYSVQYR